MSESLTSQWKVTKSAVRGKGVVVAQNVRAAQAGAEILRKGGNAIDAAVATGLAIGALAGWPLIGPALVGAAVGGGIGAATAPGGIK